MALKGYATLYKRNKVEAKCYGATNFTPPATYYFALHLATTLSTGATGGTDTIVTDDPIAIGANVIVGANTVNAEQFAVNGASGSGPYTLTLDGNMAHSHSSGAYVAFDPGEDCAEMREHSGDGYARASLTNNTSNFPAPSGGITGGAAQITWPDPSATWGLATHVVAYDASTSGNAWDVAPLSSFQLLDLSTTPSPKVSAGNYQPQATKP